MSTHDVIDNRTEKLVDHLNQILGTTERARFAVGYLFLSGLTSVAKRLLNLRELRLLIGKDLANMPADAVVHLDAAIALMKDAYARESVTEGSTAPK